MATARLLDTPKERLWSRILEQNEWFDGEPEITAGARASFERQWRENAPSRVTLYSYRTRTQVHHYFATLYEAAQWADFNAGEMAAYIVPVAGLTGDARAHVPPQYLSR